MGCLNYSIGIDIDISRLGKLDILNSALVQHAQHEQQQLNSIKLYLSLVKAWKTSSFCCSSREKRIHIAVLGAPIKRGNTTLWRLVPHCEGGNCTFLLEKFLSFCFLLQFAICLCHKQLLFLAFILPLIDL